LPVEQVAAEPVASVDRAAISVSRDVTFLQAARQLNLVVMCLSFKEDRNMRWIALTALLFVATSSGFAQDKLPGFESPEKSFLAYLTGTVSQDFDLMLSSLTPEAKAYHIGLAVVSVPYLFDKKAMEKLFADHGIDKLAGDAKEEKKDSEKAFVDAMLKVKKPAKLMQQLVDQSKKIAKMLANPDDPEPKSKAPSQKELLSSVTLSKVKITGDSAVATVAVAESAKDIFATLPKMIEFRRIKDRWYCHVDPR